MMNAELREEVKNEVVSLTNNRIEYYGTAIKEIDPFMIAEDVTEEVTDYFKDDLQDEDEDEIFDETYYIVVALRNKAIADYKEMENTNYWVA